VAAIASEIKRGFLRSLARQADAEGVTLEDALASFQTARFGSIKDGRFIASTTNGSRSVSFSIPTAVSQLQPDEFFALSEEMCAACEVAIANLLALGNSTPTNAEVRTQMLELDNFYGAKSYAVSFHDLRCH
jgi:hypothetical protein